MYCAFDLSSHAHSCEFSSYSPFAHWVKEFGCCAQDKFALWDLNALWEFFGFHCYGELPFVQKLISEFVIHFDAHFGLMKVVESGCLEDSWVAQHGQQESC